MNFEKTILEASQLVEKGKFDFTKKTNLKKYSFPDDEYFVCYDEARRLLLREGFILALDVKIQSEFYKIISEPKQFTNENENFTNLYSPDENLRLKAAKHFSKQARNENSIFREFLFSYPKTFDILLPALQDKNLKVAKEIIAALGCAYIRYFEDLRVENHLFEFYSHKNREILLATIIWTQLINKRKKYAYIFSLLKLQQPTKILEALCGHFRLDIETDLKLKAQPILLHCLKLKITDAGKNEIFKAIERTLDDETIPEFLKLKCLESDENFSKLLLRQIESYCSRERIDFLKKKLFN